MSSLWVLTNNFLKFKMFRITERSGMGVPHKIRVYYSAFLNFK